MRKIIWIAGQTPAGMTTDEYHNKAQELANHVGGECVEFGTNSRAIIGDNNAETRMKAMQDEKKKALATS